MVLAFSRFRVANECGDAVREAFLARPGLVDKAVGFLGLEVFTDTEDAALFYLLTRWTDADSFRRWHGGPNHKQSHEGIPKGLKLDAAFTLIRVLDRVSPPGERLQSDAVRDFAPVIAEYLAQSTAVHWLKVRSDGVIVAWNHAMAKSLGATADSPAGAVIWQWLTEPDAASLRSAVESGRRDAANRCRLNFVDRDRTPFTLECHLDVQADGFVLIGEAVQEDEQELQEELMTQNMRFAVLLRERDRKSKALHQANAAVERALKDLRESHWHLKKIQEVLPICMGCGKVKTSDSKWEEVVEYLRNNSLFLSHAYCPPCLAKEMMSLDDRNESH